jgi:hypothetical protein
MNVDAVKRTEVDILGSTSILPSSQAGSMLRPSPTGRYDERFELFDCFMLAAKTAQRNIYQSSIPRIIANGL